MLPDSVLRGQVSVFRQPRQHKNALHAYLDAEDADQQQQQQGCEVSEQGGQWKTGSGDTGFGNDGNGGGGDGFVVHHGGHEGKGDEEEVGACNVRVFESFMYTMQRARCGHSSNRQVFSKTIGLREAVGRFMLNSLDFLPQLLSKHAFFLTVLRK